MGVVVARERREKERRAGEWAERKVDPELNRRRR